MPAKFELKKSSNGKFRFNLLATNGQVVATSELYESKQAAQRGIASVRKIAASADLDDQTTAAGASAAATRSAAKKATAKKSAAKKRASTKATAKKRTTGKAAAEKR